MAVRKFFLHVGPAKTGTSAVQHILSTGKDLSVIYPRVGLWADGSHHNLVFNYFEDFRRPEVSRMDSRVLFDQIGEVARQTPGNLVISSEVLPSRDLRAFCSALLPHLPADEWIPEVLFTCRDHFERASSLYNQSVKDGVRMERSDPRAYLLKHLKQMCYGPTLQKIATSGLPLTILNYHPASDFVPRFMRHIGFSNPDAVTNVRRNESLSIPGMIAILAANNVAKTVDDRRRYFAALRRVRPLFASSQNIFDFDTMNAAEALFSEDRQFLARECGMHLAAPSLLAAQDRFRIDDIQLGQIADAASCLGTEGEAIVKFVQRYVRV